VQRLRAVAAAAALVLASRAAAAEHPRVLFQAANVAALREKATSTHPPDDADCAA
jgi:hypothetical protein